MQRKKPTVKKSEKSKEISCSNLNRPDDVVSSRKRGRKFILRFVLMLFRDKRPFWLSRYINRSAAARVEPQ